MKEQTRNTEVQINEEEMGKLPEKEFRIMIVNMIKNLENKMDKMQEWINKDIKELKNKHTETNNTITEIKNTLEGITSRISEAEQQISELEDKMLEITSEEQNKINRMKRTKDSLRDLRDNIKRTNIWIIGGPRRREKERVWENFLRDYGWKFPQHGKGNSQSSPRGTKSPIQDKPKEKHAKTHTNQTNKDLEELKNKHTKTNNTVPEIKNTLEGIYSRISEAQEWISELEDKMVEITSEEQSKVKRS